MIYPKKLEKGATVAMVATSSTISEEREAACVAKLEEMGFKVKKADNLTTKYGGYMAGTGEAKGKWLNEMFADPEVDAIFCIRGGHSGTRAFDYVDLDIVRKNPKIFVGYSDVTTFHLLFNQQCDLVTFHGPMVSSNMINFNEFAETAFWEALTAEGTYEFKNPEDMPIEILKEGKATGRIVGGNLAVLSGSMGTPYEIDTKDKIFFIEEVGEEVARIDRFATQMKNAGKFKDCKGVILGQFTGCSNPEDPEYDYLTYFKDILAEYDIPVMYNVQSGHDEPMVTIPFGAMCTMDTETKTIVFDVDR